MAESTANIIVALIGLIGIAVSCSATVISAKIAANVAKSQKQENERAKRRAEESKLSMDLMSATCALSVVCAKKLTNQHTNGDVEDAMSSAVSAQTAYKDFCNKQVASELSQI